MVPRLLISYSVGLHPDLVSRLRDGSDPGPGPGVADSFLEKKSRFAIGPDALQDSNGVGARHQGFAPTDILGPADPCRRSDALIILHISYIFCFCYIDTELWFLQPH
mgnify:CR=1 FL=1